MRIVRHATPGGTETALAIGSFDGVHLGHQALLARVREVAAGRGLAPAVLTFEPLPREFFSPATAPPRISSLAERLDAIAGLGIEVAYVERFGAKRAGDVELLARLGRELGFEVEVLGRVDAGGGRVSSTRVREALARGDFDLAERLLGRRYAITGRVVHGAKRGRDLGFPTANVRLARPRPALTGIFAVKCFGAATRGLEGVASLGNNPAVTHGGPATLEAFLFGFSGSLYGRRLTIEFVKKLRDEAHFASLDELAAQIRRDCEAAMAHFRTGL